MIYYIVFGGSDFYPNGGWLDFKGIYSTFEKAKNKCNNILRNKEEKNKCDWVHIVNLNTKKIIKKYFR